MANKTGSALVPLSAAGDVDVEAKLFGASSAAGVDALTSRQHRCANQAGAKVSRTLDPIGTLVKTVLYHFGTPRVHGGIFKDLWVTSF